MPENGHCSYLPGQSWILNDTYPDRQRKQHVYLYNVASGRRVPLGDFLLPGDYKGEWRCDTHPRFSPDGQNVVIDSPHAGQGRQLYLIDIRSPLAAPAAGAVDMNRRAAELKNLKWGMFICWSFSTFSGKEWTPGVKDASYFKATGCDTDQWARTAKEAGMGYILFLTKHHDGFCLWDTKTTDRKVMNSPLGRDVLAELRKSCDKHGIKLALYFSEGEFKDNKSYHPGGYTPQMKKAQLEELLTQYGPIEYIWFDHAQGTGGVNHEETVAWCHQCQPGCLIGFNHGDPAGEVRLGELGRPSALDDVSGAGYGAKNAKGYKGYRVAEFTYPILPPHKGGAMWFYSLPIHNGLCLPADKLYQDYAGAVKHGNIFSIDVGPDFNGQLRKIDVETLQKVGRMIRGEIPAPGKSPTK